MNLVPRAAAAGLPEKLKCDEYQGYLFGRPVPAAEFAQLLAANAARPPKRRRPSSFAGKIKAGRAKS